MSLVIGGILRSKVAMFGDSANTPKVIAIPCLKLVVAWTGYFNRSPISLSSPAEPEFLNPVDHTNYSGVNASIQTCINHINSLDHVHPNGAQALIFIAACHKNDQRIQVFESNGGAGDWPSSGVDLPPLFIAGCLEPFGISGAYAPLRETVSSISALANVGVQKIQSANDWRCRTGKDPRIQSPLTGYMLSRKGFTTMQRW